MAPGRLSSPSLDAPTRLPTEKSSPSISSKPAANDTYGSYYPVDPDKLSLESNFGPMEAGSVGFLQPTSAETPLDIMHERFERDGYLFVCANTFLYGNTNTLSHIGQRMYSQRSLPQMSRSIFQPHGA